MEFSYMGRVATACFVLAVCTACVTSSGGDDGIRDGKCQEDFVNRVEGGPICFLIRSFLPPSKNRETLMVFIHGDPKTYAPNSPANSLGLNFLNRNMTDLGRRPQKVFGTTVGVYIWRPGVGDGRQSSSSGRYGQHYADNRTLQIADWIAAAIARLKARHRARQVIVVGHSGGAQLTTGIISRHPGLVQTAVLFGCYCGTYAGGSVGTIRHLDFDPAALAADVDPTVKVVAITGDRDTVTPPQHARAYVEALKKQGIDAVFLESEGVDHLMGGADRMWNDLFRAMGRTDLAS